MLDKTATILTRVVLTEKAPFWVDVYDNGDFYCGTYLVKTHVNRVDCYIVVGYKATDVIVAKKDCKRVNKQ